MPIRHRQTHLPLLANKPLLKLLDEPHTPARIQKQLETPLHILDLDALPPPLLRQQTARRDQIARVPQSSFLADLGQQGQGVGRDVDFLLGGADGEDLADLVGGVGVGGDDDDAVEEVEGEAVRGAVGGAADAGAAAVRGHDDDGREVGFEGAVDVGEAFDVEHVDLVDEEDAGHDLGLAFFLPFADFGVDLVAHFAADLARVAGEEGEEALGAGVDDVDFVQGDGVDDFFALLQLAVGALDELGVGAHGVVVARAGKGAAEFGDFAGRFVNGDDVAGHDAFFGHGVDHFGAHVVDGFHVRGFDG